MDLNFDFTEKRVIITAFFCMAFTIANLITVKIISIDFIGMQTPAGVLIYPLVYILTNVIADVYGERTARRTIILGLCVDVLFVFMTTLILFLPSPSFYTGDSSLAFVFTQTPRILIASYISYLIGNFVNARITTMVNAGEKYSSHRCICNLNVPGQGCWRAKEWRSRFARLPSGRCSIALSFGSARQRPFVAGARS